MIKNKRLSAGDAAEDGHPCEVALSFRLAAIRSDIVDEIPADVLDLAIQFAWIGKAVSRTASLDQWCMSGIDPNTREMVAAMATDHQTRQTALAQAIRSKASYGLESSLRSIRSSQAFMHALKVVQSICSRTPSVTDIERLAILADLSSKLSDTKRLAISKAFDGVLSLEAFRKRKRIAG